MNIIPEVKKKNHYTARVKYECWQDFRIDSDL